ncbi:MAG: YetF domain-containing protein [Eubacteriales bacterium]
MFSNGYLNIIFSSVIVYIFIIIAIRITGKKELSQLSVIDLVFILLISNSVQNAMVGPDTSLLGGLVAAAALFAVNFVLKDLIYRFPGLGKLLQGQPIMLVYNGKLNADNMKRARLSMAELEEAIREHGVSGVSDVNLAVLEVDGNISVLSSDYQNRTVRKRKSHKGITKDL